MEWAWLIPVFCFAAAPVIVVAGKFLPGKGASLSILAVAAGFALFWVVLAGFLGSGPASNDCFTSVDTRALTCAFSLSWFQAGDVQFFWGMVVDPLAVVMLGLVTFVALLVQIYSLGYMRDDPRFSWYFAVHSLFAAAMLTLVLADNFLLLYVAWELVGICSYLLIGFWHERPAAKEAAKKAFIVTRIGDVGLLVGILLLWREVGSFSMSDAFDAARTGAMSEGVTTAAALLLFLGAMGKSAQVPFHVWLPDAMEGPTPVSALIHAATMVVAGVYLVARAFPIFQAYDADPLLVVAIVGLATALMAASIALVATDLKRILAYSTISHLGLMMLSLGAFGYTAAVFHLLAHGFAKALLFLAAGSVLHSTGEQDIRRMGGLRRVMPLTALVFSVGALSLGGIPIFAGYWSKEEVLAAVGGNRNAAFLALTLLASFLSALYMSRAMFAAFFGKAKPESAQVHEAPALMAWPMVLLAVLAAGFGWVSFNWPGGYDGLGTFLFFGQEQGFKFTWWLGVLSAVLALGAFALALLIYVRAADFHQAAWARFAPGIRVVENKYYFDEVYQWTVDRVVLAFSRLVALFDRAVVNDLAVNGPAHFIRRLGVSLRLHVTGRVYSYALGMALGTVGLAIFWWLRST